MNIRRDSPTCKIWNVHEWTVFKVRDNQLGLLMPYRGKWVLMYCVDKFGFNVYLWAFPLRKGAVSEDSLNELKLEFENKFCIVDP